MSPVEDMAVPNSTASSNHAVEELSLGVLFITMLIFLGGTFFMIYKNRIPLPYTVVLLLYGIAVGFITQWLWPEVVSTLGSIPPELIFYIFLPVLIFEGSYAMNIHALRRVLWQTIILASVGLLINTALLGVAVKVVYSDWSWYAAMLLGSLLSATDPVAVVSLLKGLRIEKNIAAMVDGESVMNDGTAIIIFSLLLPAARVGSITEPIWLVLLNCVRLSILPLLLGPMFGFVQSFWLRHAEDGLTKACITVSVTYVSYYIAAYWIHASGVLTLFCQGVFLSYTCPSLFPGVEGNFIYATWELLVHLGNTVLFSLVGVIVVADVFPTVTPVDVAVVLFLYVAMIFSRLVMVESLLPVLNLFSFRMSQRHVGLLVHAGLRGGVAATLALVVQQEDLKEGVVILKVTCGVVLLTLLINATTADFMVGLLGFKSKEPYRIIQMKFSMDYLFRTMERALERVKRDPKYRNANWMSVEKYVGQHLKNPYEGVTEEPSSKDPTQAETVMLNRLLMSAFKNALWRQRDEEVISETVVLDLGAVIARKIEKGELFHMREMQWFHRSGRWKGPIRPAPALPTTGTSPSLVHAGTSGAVCDGQRLENTTFDLAVSMDALDEELPTDDAALHMEVTADSSLMSSTALQLQDDSADQMVEALMRRLLPTWVIFAERFVVGQGYFAKAHRRAQENAFMTLLAVVKCLSALYPLKYQYVENPAQARRIQQWLTAELQDGNAVIQFFFNHFPEATNTVSSTRAVVSIANSLREASDSLHANYGLGVRTREIVEGMIHGIRENIPAHWPNDIPAKSSELITQAVAATTLGKGLRRAEIRAIATMGLERHLREHEVIRLPENAFLIVVFGSLQAIHGRWTIIQEQEYVESFGDIAGLESMLLPAALRKDHERKWRVISTAATVLFISFNSIRPFLMERSLRSVKALWRAAAEDVVLPFLEMMVTPPRDGTSNNIREHLRRIVMDGTPIIGPRDCAQFDWNTQFHLCFYLRGCDNTGLFSGHTPPCYVSTFFASQLEWTDPDVVLYAVPMNISNSGYVPWTTTASDVEVDVSMETAPGTPHHGERPQKPIPSMPRNGLSQCSVEDESLPSFTDCSARRRSPFPKSRSVPSPEVTVTTSTPALIQASLRADVCVTTALPSTANDIMESSHAATTTVLSSILLGIIPVDERDEISESGHTSASRAHRDGHSIRRESVGTLTGSLVFSVDDLCAGGHRSGLRFSPDITCILQRLDQFVSPVPIINQLFAEYAAMLELMCIAAFRYVRYPRDPQNVRHAQRTAASAIEFLLNFCLQSSLIRRAVRVFGADHPEEMHALDPDHNANAIDARFESSVCTWSRQAAISKKYNLETIVTGMNVYANLRFRGVVKALQQAVLWVPELTNVESVEGVQTLISARGGGIGASSEENAHY